MRLEQRDVLIAFLVTIMHGGFGDIFPHEAQKQSFLSSKLGWSDTLNNIEWTLRLMRGAMDEEDGNVIRKIS